jgi:hypothetical protein
MPQHELKFTCRGILYAGQYICRRSTLLFLIQELVSTLSYPQHQKVKKQDDNIVFHGVQVHLNICTRKPYPMDYEIVMKLSGSAVFFSRDSSTRNFGGKIL